uniref:Uncharacterized protein n=1 Tax=Lotus japonicus TaxID=34305 RepID=I3SQW7_LOTJA|nr:unknown [Lotus japonicus]
MGVCRDLDSWRMHHRLMPLVVLVHRLLMRGFSFMLLLVMIDLMPPQVSRMYPTFYLILSLQAPWKVSP